MNLLNYDLNFDGVLIDTSRNNYPAFLEKHRNKTLRNDTRHRVRLVNEVHSGGICRKAPCGKSHEEIWTSSLDETCYPPYSRKKKMNDLESSPAIQNTWACETCERSVERKHRSDALGWVKCQVSSFKCPCQSLYGLSYTISKNWTQMRHVRCQWST